MLSLPHGRLFLVIGWLLIAGIVIGSLMPSVPSLGVTITDKVQHFTGYFLLMFWFAGLYPKHQHGWLALGFLLMGAAIEILQGTLTTTRAMDWHDLMANAAGIATAFILGRLGFANWARRIEALWNKA